MSTQKRASHPIYNLLPIELYSDGVNGGEPERQEMRRGQPLVESNGYTFNVQVPSTHPAAVYTARVIPQHTGIEVPLEANRILWQL
jgi:starch phosphorylase